MITDTADKRELFLEIEETVVKMQELFLALDQNQVNIVPYDGSWTAGQLLRHIYKSTSGMAKVMLMEAKPAQRDAGERIPELKKAFLDFSTKMQSPESIVPEPGPYEKSVIMAEVSKSFQDLKENTPENLNALVEGLPLGPITKLEMLHFVLYHTQRHLHQLKKICNALNKK